MRSFQLVNLFSGGKALTSSSVSFENVFLLVKSSQTLNHQIQVQLSLFAFKGACHSLCNVPARVALQLRIGVGEEGEFVWPKCEPMRQDSVNVAYKQVEQVCEVVALLELVIHESNTSKVVSVLLE